MTGTVLVAMLLASCASGSGATPVLVTPDPNAAANAATDSHVAVTVARLGALSEAAFSGSKEAVLADMAAMANSLEQERAWLAAHAVVSRPSVRAYMDRIVSGLDALTAALKQPSASTIKAAGDAMSAVRAAGSAVTGGD